MAATGTVRREPHDWEQTAARGLMTMWGVPLAASGAIILLDATFGGARDGITLAFGASYLIASVPAFVAWSSEEVGGRLLVAAGILLPIVIGILEFADTQAGDTSNGAVWVIPWWVYAATCVLSGLPAFAAGLLLLDHLRRHDAVTDRKVADRDRIAVGERGAYGDGAGQSWMVDGGQSHG